MTVQRSPFLTQSVALVPRRRSLCLVRTMSPTEARLPSASSTSAAGTGAGKASCAGGLVQSCDEIAGGRQHQALAAIRPFGHPGAEDLAEAGVDVSAVHAVVVEVEPEGGSVTGTQVEGGGCLDRVGEPDDLLEAYGAVRAGDVAQDSAGADRGELLVVSDEPDPGASVAAGGDDSVEGGRVGHAGLVDDDDGVRADAADPGPW